MIIAKYVSLNNLIAINLSASNNIQPNIAEITNGIPYLDRLINDSLLIVKENL